MTAPDSVGVPQPGWWARTGRIGVNLTAGFGWSANPVGSTVMAGHTSGTYQFAKADAIGQAPTPPTFKGINYSATTSVTLPTHAVGDIIIIYAYDAGATSNPGAPSAAGTVPTWTTIDNPGGANANASGTFYAVATATNHTSGAWTLTTAMVAVVLSGQSVSTPIGGHAESGSTSNSSVTAPSVTMVNTDTTSVLLHFFGTRTNPASWSAAPTGYTQRGTPNIWVACDTKNDTTSDGSVTQGFATVGSSLGYRGETVEIRSH